MSMETMLDLDLFKTFSKPHLSGSCNMLSETQESKKSMKSPMCFSKLCRNGHSCCPSEQGQSSSHPPVSEPCSCKKRTLPPQRPRKLPFEAISENNGKMESWLRTQFASSTFNVCPSQQLPEMSGPPVEIHLKDGAKPFKAQTAVSVPLNWQPKVKEQYARDEPWVLSSVPLQMMTLIGASEKSIVPNQMVNPEGQLIFAH